ncbi:MAG TPA: hypothetical protein VLW84_01710 [Terriglobales bacterium]|nr:hypothetical protein [Terriglobales bacterium]
MELILNLLWLLLAIPAVWLWRRGPVHAPDARWLPWFRPLLLLACVLVLLFPVVSATDDIHAMRSEAEEPGLSKRSVRISAGDRSPLRFTGFGAPVSEPFAAVLSSLATESCGRILELYATFPDQLEQAASGCRAPPILL